MGLYDHRELERRNVWSEPLFEPPPRFAGAGDRRLAGRATALWESFRRDSWLPDAALYAEALAAHPDVAASSVILDLGTPYRIEVVAVGTGVAAGFGLRPGPLASGGPLAQRLIAACADTGLGPAHFEGLLARDPGGPATLLTRAVVLPLAGAGGQFLHAHAVVAWRETLPRYASDRLENELRRAFRPRQAPSHSVQPVSAAALFGPMRN